MIPTGIGIRAVGGHLPARVLTNAELEQLVPTRDSWIRDNIGVEQRRVAAADEWSSDLGVAALRDACAAAGVDVGTIDLVICGTFTPDHMLPATALAILRKLGLTGVPGFDVNSGGCPGGVYALDVGAKYVASGDYRRVAVVVADVTTKTFDWAGDRSATVIFGDGAACYLLEPIRTPGRGLGRTILRADPSRYFTAYISREPRVDRGGQPTRSAFGDNFATLNGREVREFAYATVPDFTRELVKQAALDLGDVDLFVFHQANKHIIHGIMDRLGLPVQKTVTNVELCGNTSGAGLALALRDAVNAYRVAPGDLVALVTFGSGMAYGGTLIRWCGPDDFD
jgi:3-oxoacyl-[acyl-carrier-protein] synthase-3